MTGRRFLLRPLVTSFLVAVRTMGSSKKILPIFKSAIEYKHKVCVRDRRGEYTFVGLARSGRQLSEEVAELCGRERQQRVAVLCPCSGFTVLAQWAAWMSGQIVVPLEVDMPGEVLRTVLERSGCRLVMTTAEMSESLRELAPPDTKILVMHTELLDKARAGTHPGEEEVPTCDLWPEAYGLSADFYADKDALLLYTAGTTGSQKGVLLSYSNLCSQVRSVVRPWGLTSSDCILNLRPLSTTDGIACGLLAPLSVGASVILVDKFVIEEVWAEILGVQGKTERMNILYGESKMYKSLIDEYEKVKDKRKWNAKMEEYVKGICIQKIRLMLSTGSPIPKSILEKWETYTGHEVFEVYSLTEGGVVTTPRPSTSKHTSTVGLPVPGIKVKIMSDDGDVIAEGDSSGTKVLSIWENRPVAGVLWLKGDAIAKEYLDEKEEKTSWSVDGWFNTGDIVSFSKGQYNVLGRQQCDIAKTKTYKISLHQIEAAILDIPQVQDVAAFSIIQNGVSVIAAAICRKSGLVLNFEDIKAILRLRFPEYAVPSVIIDVPMIPRNYRGIIVRNEIHSYFSEEFQKLQTLREKGGDIKAQ